MKKSLVFVLSLALLIGTASVAFAIPIAGTGTTGSFTGSFDYLSHSDTSATISVTLTNTTPAEYGNYLTAFAFLIPENANITQVQFSASPDMYATAFSDIGGSTYDGTIKAEPFGSFDLGASATTTGAQPFLGGGKPVGDEGGIATGDTADFVFGLTGTGFNSITLGSFFDNTDTVWFVTRFRGGESDKVPAAPVPEPGTLLLLGAGILGLAGASRKKFKK